MKSVKQCSTKGFTKKRVVKMLDSFPRSNTSNSDLRNKNMNMRIPLKTAAKGMENTNETGSKVLSFVEFAEQAKNDIPDGMKKTVEQRTVSAKENAKFFGDSENAMSVNALNDFERHGSSALNGIEIAAGRTKAAFAAKRDKFERTTRSTPEHSSAVSRISAMNHLFDAFENNRASLKGVLDFFVVV